MCFKCIKNKCLESAEFIFLLKDKLNDQEYKQLLDNYKFIFDATTNLENYYKMIENYEDNVEDEDENDSEDNIIEINTSTYEAIYNMFSIDNYSYYKCNCNITDLIRTSDIPKCFELGIGMIEQCNLYTYIIDAVPYFKYITDLFNNKIPEISSSFILQTNPNNLYNEFTIERNKFCFSIVKLLLNIVSTFRIYLNNHAGNKYIVFVILIMYDYIFRNFNILCIGDPRKYLSYNRFRLTMIQKLNEFNQTLENIQKIQNVQELIPHINIRELFNKWKDGIRSVEQQDN